MFVEELITTAYSFWFFRRMQYICRHLLKKCGMKMNEFILKGAVCIIWWHNRQNINVMQYSWVFFISV